MDNEIGATRVVVVIFFTLPRHGRRAPIPPSFMCLRQVFAAHANDASRHLEPAREAAAYNLGNQSMRAKDYGRAAQYRLNFSSALPIDFVSLMRGTIFVSFSSY